MVRRRRGDWSGELVLFARCGSYSNYHGLVIMRDWRELLSADRRTKQWVVEEVAKSVVRAVHREYGARMASKGKRRAPR